MQSGTSESLRAARPRLKPLFNIRGFFIFTTMAFEMTIFKTNSGLGHKQYAYFVKCAANEYLCIRDEFGCNLFQHGGIYQVGNLAILEQHEIIEEQELKFADFPFTKTWIFGHFIGC